jgi:hypothetical protein
VRDPQYDNILIDNRINHSMLTDAVTPQSAKLAFQRRARMRILSQFRFNLLHDPLRHRFSELLQIPPD